MTTPTSSTPPDAVSILREALNAIADFSARSADVALAAAYQADQVKPAPIEAGELPLLPEKNIVRYLNTGMEGIGHNDESMQAYGQLCRDTKPESVTGSIGDDGEAYLNEWRNRALVAENKLSNFTAPATSSIGEGVEFNRPSEAFAYVRDMVSRELKTALSSDRTAHTVDAVSDNAADKLLRNMWSDTGLVALMRPDQRRQLENYLDKS